MQTERVAAPRIFISLSDPYAQTLLSEAAASAGWDVCAAGKECAVCWADFGAIDWDRVLEGQQCGSAYYMKTGLVRKAELATFAAKREAVRMPLTLCGDFEDVEDVEEFLVAWCTACKASSERLWILKPSLANRGEGIYLVRVPAAADAANSESSSAANPTADASAADASASNVAEEATSEACIAIRAAIAAHPRHSQWLLQRYVHPLLLSPLPSSGTAMSPLPPPVVAPPTTLPPAAPPTSELPFSTLPPVAPLPSAPSGCKFHLRAWVLAVGALGVWVHHDPLVMLASEAWKAPTSTISAASVARAHVTNHAQQEHAPGYSQERHTLCLSEAFTPPAAVAICRQLEQICRAVFAPRVRPSAGFFALPHCFELFGVDFAVDEQQRLWLLELNSGPDLSLFGDRCVAAWRGVRGERCVARGARCVVGEAQRGA